MHEDLLFYFDISCPYAYIAFSRIKRAKSILSTEYNIIYSPVLLGGIYKALYGQGIATPTHPLKIQHTNTDIYRWASYYDIPLSKPAAHPQRTVDILRLILSAPEKTKEALIEDAFSCYWHQPRRVNQDLAKELAERHQLPKTSRDSQNKQYLRTHTDHAIKKGVFGVPSFELAGEIYWGQDKLDLLAARKNMIIR